MAIIQLHNTHGCSSSCVVIVYQGHVFVEQKPIWADTQSREHFPIKTWQRSWKIDLNLEEKIKTPSMNNQAH